MTETSGSTHISGGATVFLLVSDQDRARDFYVGMLGFEQVADFDYGDGSRWVEVAPPGGALRVALVTPVDGVAPGVETRVAVGSEDVEADHATLRARGVDADEAILRAGDPPVHWGGAVLAGVPPMFLVRDPDGNSLLVVQQS